MKLLVCVFIFVTSNTYAQCENSKQNIESPQGKGESLSGNLKFGEHLQPDYTVAVAGKDMQESNQESQVESTLKQESNVQLKYAPNEGSQNKKLQFPKFIDLGRRVKIEKTITIIRGIPKFYPVERIVRVPIEKEIKVPVKVPVPIPYPVEKTIPFPVRVPVQVAVAIPRPYPIEKRVPVPVKVYVDEPYPVTVYEMQPYPEKQMRPQYGEKTLKPYHLNAEQSVSGPVQVPAFDDGQYSKYTNVPSPSSTFVETRERGYENPITIMMEKQIEVPYETYVHTMTTEKPDNTFRLSLPKSFSILKNFNTSEKQIKQPFKISVNRPIPLFVNKSLYSQGKKENISVAKSGRETLKMS